METIEVHGLELTGDGSAVVSEEVGHHASGISMNAMLLLWSHLLVRFVVWSILDAELCVVRVSHVDASAGITQNKQEEGKTQGRQQLWLLVAVETTSTCCVYFLSCLPSPRNYWCRMTRDQRDWLKNVLDAKIARLSVPQQSFAGAFCSLIQIPRYPT